MAKMFWPREKKTAFCVFNCQDWEDQSKAQQRKVAALQRGSRRPASPVVSVSCLPREDAATGTSTPGELGTWSASPHPQLETGILHWALCHQRHQLPRPKLIRKRVFGSEEFELSFCLMHLKSLQSERCSEVKFWTLTEVPERIPPCLQSENTSDRPWLPGNPWITYLNSIFFLSVLRLFFFPPENEFLQGPVAKDKSRFIFYWSWNK